MFTTSAMLQVSFVCDVLKFIIQPSCSCLIYITPTISFPMDPLLMVQTEATCTDSTFIRHISTMTTKMPVISYYILTNINNFTEPTF